jgi:hypothetical protein
LSRLGHREPVSAGIPRSTWRVIRVSRKASARLSRRPASHPAEEGATIDAMTLTERDGHPDSDVPSRRSESSLLTEGCPRGGDRRRVRASEQLVLPGSWSDKRQRLCRWTQRWEFGITRLARQPSALRCGVPLPTTEVAASADFHRGRVACMLGLGHQACRRVGERVDQR